ncbi:hypothetical protein M409DRAFT_48811 [Zasmidium cellare ATCC 36951]|uniref:SH3 domain-containing protein n=1 Tax=Zasmidium cellare ATCC 36951 TaxID=1080233 RepID=A0A6A6D6E3_ZASCE|nr:uncharacterized protein M409DRAFT_48811 [Zasmidium cellare ATCC 36951]KAF2173900.1 hypothetical protein M409DRAFT_48811 [Zasmidium cellare ATCC 36951]
MGLHKRHTHGRVFRGLEAREQLQIRKRDSHGSNVKMNIPKNFQQKETVDDTQTAVNVVYVTLSQTFDGPAIYSTLGESATSAPKSDAQATAASSANDAQASYEAVKSSAQAGNKPSTTATSVATVTPHSSEASPMTTLATATSALAASSMAASTSSDSPAVVGGTPLSATRSATPDASEQSSGMTGGAKAGLAIGILAIIALAAGLIFFCYRRKKSAKAHEELMDEKHGSFADAGARRVEAGGKRDSTMTERVPASLRSTRTASTAPRLSLRPVTQFLPNLSEQPKANGNNLEVSAAGVSEKPRSAWEREPAQAAQNPFADADATMLSEKQARPDSPPSNPFDEPEGKKSSDSQGSAGGMSAATTAVGGAAAAAGAEKKHSPKSSWEGSEPPTPKSTKFGTAAAVPVAAAGAARDVPPPRGPNNVHRVQLDFKPSMDDELELRSGQLVRMLHEYDDGWPTGCRTPYLLVKASCKATTPRPTTAGFSPRYGSGLSPSIKPTGPKRRSWRGVSAPFNADPVESLSVPDGDEWRGFDYAGWRPGEEASPGPGNVDPPFGAYRGDRSFSDPFPCVDELRAAINDYLYIRGWNVSPSTSPAAEDRNPLDSDTSLAGFHFNDRHTDPGDAGDNGGDNTLRRINTLDTSRVSAVPPVPPLPPVPPVAPEAQTLPNLFKVPLPNVPPPPPIPKRASVRQSRRATLKYKRQTRGQRKTFRQSEWGDTWALLDY